MTIFSECFHLKGKVVVFFFSSKTFPFLSFSLSCFLPFLRVCVSMPFPAGIASICYLTLLNLTPKLVSLWSSQSFSALYSLHRKLLLLLDLGIDSRMRFSVLAHYQKHQALSTPPSTHWALPLGESLFYTPYKKDLSGSLLRTLRLGSWFTPFLRR